MKKYAFAGGLFAIATAMSVVLTGSPAEGCPCARAHIQLASAIAASEWLGAWGD